MLRFCAAGQSGQDSGGQGMGEEGRGGQGAGRAGEVKQAPHDDAMEVDAGPSVQLQPSSQAGKNAKEADDEPSPAQLMEVDGAASEEPCPAQLHPSSLVLSHGLTQSPDLNGSRASVVRYDAKLQRWRVKTEGGKALALRACNLQPIPSEEGAMAAPPAVSSGGEGAGSAGPSAVSGGGSGAVPAVAGAAAAPKGGGKRPRRAAAASSPAAHTPEHVPHTGTDGLRTTPSGSAGDAGTTSSDRLAYKSGGDVHTLSVAPPPDPLPEIRTPLWPHQRDARDRVLRGLAEGKRGFADASAVGAGKTLTAIATLVGVAEHLQACGMRRSGCLVLVPTPALINEWVVQASKHARGFHVIEQRENGVLFSRTFDKAHPPLCPNALVVSTLDRVRAHEFVRQAAWDFVVIDECLSVQNHDAIRCEPNPDPNRNTDLVFDIHPIHPVIRVLPPARPCAGL